MKILNQKGLATLEIILVTTVVAIFATSAVPKLANIMDKAVLDYEVKKFCSELNFAQSVGRTSGCYSEEIFSKGADWGSVNIDCGHATFFRVYGFAYETEVNNHKFHRQNLPAGFTINVPTDDLKNITINPDGRNGLSNHYTFISRQGKKLFVNLDSVGRVRVSNK